MKVFITVSALFALASRALAICDQPSVAACISAASVALGNCDLQDFTCLCGEQTTLAGCYAGFCPDLPSGLKGEAEQAQGLVTTYCTQVRSSTTSATTTKTTTDSTSSDKSTVSSTGTATGKSAKSVNSISDTSEDSAAIPGHGNTQVVILIGVFVALASLF